MRTLVRLVAVSWTAAIVVAVSPGSISAQSQEPALSLSIEPLGIWCETLSPVLVTVRNEGSEVRWIGLHPLEEEMVPMFATTVGFRVDLGGGRSSLGIFDGFAVSAPAQGVALLPGDKLVFTDNLVFNRNNRNSVPWDPPYRVQTDWEFYGYESPSGAPDTWEPIQPEATAYFRVEEIQGSDCVVARVEE